MLSAARILRTVEVNIFDVVCRVDTGYLCRKRGNGLRVYRLTEREWSRSNPAPDCQGHMSPKFN